MYVVVVLEDGNDEQLIFLLCITLLLSLKQVIPVFAVVFPPGLSRNLALTETGIISLKLAVAQKQTHLPLLISSVSERITFH
jgi:hypothetical protein